MTHRATVLRRVDATPERTWRALLSEELAGWFWPPSFETRATVDPRAGGAYHVRSDAMAMGAGGTFDEVEAGRRVAGSWRWDGGPEETRVVIELEPDEAGGTRIRVVHEGFASAATADEHALGWTDCLDRLPAWLDHTA